MSARTIPWETIADWYKENEQVIRDVMKFEGLRGAVNGVLRIAPEQPELAALREELAEAKRQLTIRDEGPNCWTCGDQGYVHSIDGELLGTCDNCTVYELMCTKHSLTAAEQRNAGLSENLENILDIYEGVTRSAHCGIECDDEAVAEARAALKPTESGASE